jgi:FMN phosphatase YigB (HAD superfamily)
VVSNTVGELGSFLRPFLEKAGIASRVRTFAFSDEHPWTKPAPELFWLAVDGLSSTAGESVHVGDSWADVEGARRAGFATAFYYTGLHEYGPHYRQLHASPHAVPREVPRIEVLADLPVLIKKVLSP